MQAIAEAYAIAEKELRPDTVRTYRKVCQSFIQFLEEKDGLLPANKLDGQIVSNFLDTLARQGLAGATCNTYLRVLKAIGARMNARGIENRIGKGIKARKEVQARNMPFTDAQKDALLQYFKENSKAMYLVALLQYHAFLRPAEISRLKVGDIDLRAQVIRISGEQSKNGKNANIPIAPPLQEALRRYGIQGESPSSYLIGKGMAPGMQQISRTRFNEAHTKAMRACGISASEGLTLYTWKDTGACNAYKAGLDIKTLQAMLRHSTVSTTEVYLRSLSENIQANIKGVVW